MRCPDCNKFRSQETNDPQCDETEIHDTTENDDDGNRAKIIGAEVTWRGTIERTCSDCGTTMTTGSYDITEEIAFDDPHDAPKGEDHELVVDFDDATFEEGGTSRKPEITVAAAYRVKCDCAPDVVLHEGTLEDSLETAAFEEA